MSDRPTIPRARIHRAGSPVTRPDVTDDPFAGMVFAAPDAMFGDAVEVLPAGRSAAQQEGFEAGYGDGFAAGESAGWEAGHAKGYDAGVREGLVTGRADAVAEAREEVRAAWAPRLEEAARALTAAADGFANHHVDAVAELEQAVTTLVFDLASAVVGHAVTLGHVDPAQVLRRALQLAPHGPATVRMHPDDAETVTGEALEALAGTRTVKLLPDATVGRGGAIVEARDATVDMRLEAAFARAARALGLPDPASPTPPSAPPPPTDLR